MKKFASINEEGEVMGVVAPSTDDAIESGVSTDPANPAWVYYEITPDLLELFNSNTYWHDTRNWRIRVGQPSAFHYWKNSIWNLDSESLWTEIRKLRNAHLTKCDWTQINDAPLTESQKAEWSIYRQALRDIPANNPNVEFVAEVNWPIPPTT